MKTAEIKVQKKSGFDKSHMNLFTTKVGTLTPILCDEVIPNTTTDLHLNLSASLPPLASETFMRCDVKAEAFFVPSRILVSNYEDWYTNSPVYTAVTATAADGYAKLPVISIRELGAVSAGTLADYLGFKVNSAATQGAYPSITMLPFLAYHKIYDEWYRNTLVQKSIYRNVHTYNAVSGTGAFYVSNIDVLPLWTKGANALTGNMFLSNNVSAMTFSDGVSLLSTRQRNFGADYFTTATLSPQNGDAQKLTMSVTAGGDSGQTSFTIAALRAALS